MPLFGSGFEAQKKLKPNLKMATQRMAMVVNKKTNQVKRHKGEIVELIRIGKIDKANIKVEHVIREDRTIEAYEIISLMCELLVERLNLIAADKICPSDLVSSIHTVIWAAPRLEAPELKVVTQQFGLKYGKDFVRRARQNADGMVNEKIMGRLNIQPPSREDRERYMKEMAALAGVEWSDDMISGSTLVGVFDDGSAVGSKAADVPELPTFASYQGGGGPGGAGAGAGAGRPGPGGYGGGFAAPQNAMGGGYPRGVPAAAPAGAYPPMAGPGMGGPGVGGPGMGGFPQVPGGGVPPRGMPYRTGDPTSGVTTSWQMNGGAPAGGMPAPGPAPGPVPSFPMPPSNAATAEYGRATFNMAISAPTGKPGAPAMGMGGAGGMAAGPAGVGGPGPHHSGVPAYAPPSGKGDGAGASGEAGLGPSRAAAPSAVPDFDELSARFAALRDA